MGVKNAKRKNCREEWGRYAPRVISSATPRLFRCLRYGFQHKPLTTIILRRKSKRRIEKLQKGPAPRGVSPVWPVGGFADHKSHRQKNFVRILALAFQLLKGQASGPPREVRNIPPQCGDWRVVKGAKWPVL